MLMYGNKWPMARNKLPTTVYLTEEQYQLLKQLHNRTKVPMAEYIREGVDLIIRKYRKELPGQQLNLVEEEEKS